MGKRLRVGNDECEGHKQSTYYTSPSKAIYMYM